MKRIISKIAFLILIFGIYFISPTNSSFVDLETSNGNSFTAGCWGAPNTPNKISPSDIVSSHSVNFSWESATNHCPNSQTFYNFQIFTDSSAQHLYYESGWITNTFFNLNNLADGHYWWRVQTKDGSEYINSNPASWQLTVDATIPSSFITKPWNSDNDHDVIFPIIWFWNGKVEGTAIDNGLFNSGVDHVELSIERDLAGVYWSGDTSRGINGWVNGTENTVRVTATGTTNWFYEIKPFYIPFGKFRIVAHAVDKAGNVENSATIEFENSATPPCQPDVQLNTNNGRASFTAICTSGYSKLDYELTYLSDNNEKGLGGSIDINNQSEIIRDNLTLGSCSSLGEVCSYDPNTTNLKLKVDLISQNGEILTIIKELP